MAFAIGLQPSFQRMAGWSAMLTSAPRRSIGATRLRRAVRCELAALRACRTRPAHSRAHPRARICDLSRPPFGVSEPDRCRLTLLRCCRRLQIAYVRLLRTQVLTPFPSRVNPLFNPLRQHLSPPAVVGHPEPTALHPTLDLPLPARVLSPNKKQPRAGCTSEARSRST
jgi:hypothetical protein